MEREAEESQTREKASVLRRVWRTRWGALRLLVAAALLVTTLRDNPARLTRIQLAALPNYDYAGDVRHLRDQGRFGEALMVADAGMQELEGIERAELTRERQTTIEYRDSKWRKLRDGLRGAAVGRGDTVAELVGAVGADMLVVGDVRDILIQGTRLAVDGETDEVILALSAVGVATTVAPEVDWAASLMKVARKAGAMSQGLAESMLKIARQALKTGDKRELVKVSGDVFAISAKASPGGAIRLMRYADEPKDIEKMADFVKRDSAGAFALHATGKEGVSVLKTAGKGAETSLTIAAKKGDAGMAWLRSGNARLLRPHPIIGLSKVMYKGTGPQLVDRVAREFLDPQGYWVIGGLAAWVFLELALIYRRLTR